ncbi:hypothetical protein GF337_09130 [candidate division KSB1 bacterium]|nr:hypothetical protein [candidate division KSB1 bacterium]
MKKLISVFLLIFFIIFGCGKSEKYTLEKDTPAYNFAKELAEKVPALSPEENTVIVSTNSFEVKANEITKMIYVNTGKRSQQISSFDPDRLSAFFQQTARGYAEQKLLLNAAEEADVEATEAEVDSMLNIQYQRSGGEEKFKQWLTTNEIDLENVRQDMRERATIEKYFSQLSVEQVDLSEEELRKAYEGDKTATVRHILLLTTNKSEGEKKEIHEKMEDILQRAKRGEDFAELAKKYSEDPGSKNTGGLYEDFGRGYMVKPFEEAAFNVPVGEISDIIETQYGYHILKVIDRKKETRPFEEFKKSYRNQKKAEKMQQVRISKINELKEEADFKVHEL